MRYYYHSAGHYDRSRAMLIKYILRCTKVAIPVYPDKIPLPQLKSITADQLPPFYHHNNWKLKKRTRMQTIYSCWISMHPRAHFQFSQMNSNRLEVVTVHPEKGRVMGMGFCKYDMTTAEMESMKLLMICLVSSLYLVLAKLMQEQ